MGCCCAVCDRRRTLLRVFRDKGASVTWKSAVEGRRDGLAASITRLQDRPKRKEPHDDRQPRRADGSKVYLTLNSATVIDVDPVMEDVDWLRQWALRQEARELVNAPFPDGIFDIGVLNSSPIRCLYTIAEIDDFARAAPKEILQGYMSVVVMQVRLFENWKRHMLLSGDCCNTAVYANATTTKCKHCGRYVRLRPDPNIVYRGSRRRYAHAHTRIGGPDR